MFFEKHNSVGFAETKIFPYFSLLKVTNGFLRENRKKPSFFTEGLAAKDEVRVRPEVKTRFLFGFLYAKKQVPVRERKNDR